MSLFIDNVELSIPQTTPAPHVYLYREFVDFRKSIVLCKCLSESSMGIEQDKAISNDSKITLLMA